MGEDLAEVDVRQRKSGKNKNPGDEGYSSPGENVHGASKRRRRGRNDKLDGNLSTPEKDVTIEAIDLKGKIGKKREVNVDDGDDGDDYNPLDLEDEESSGSWLFKLVIIAIIVSLGFSLMWFNDGDSSRDLGEIVSDGESIDDGVESYVSSKIDDDSDDDRDRGDISLESDDKSYEDKYQEYQQTSEFQDNSQWNHDYSDSNRMDGEIVAEVSGSLGDSSNEEAEYQVNQNEDYSQNQPEVDQQPSEEWSWFSSEPSYQDNSAPETPSEEVNPTPEADSNPTYNEEQSAPSFEQQAWQYQEQQNEPEQQQTPEQFYEPTQEQAQAQAQEPYEPRPDDQQAQPIVDTPEQYVNPPVDNYEPYLETGYFECPEGSHWDGLACVDSNSYGQIDNTNDYVAQPDSTTESIIHPEQQ